MSEVPPVHGLSRRPCTAPKRSAVPSHFDPPFTTEPFTLNHDFLTLNLNPKPQTPDPKRQTLNPQPSTLNPSSETLEPNAVPADTAAGTTRRGHFERGGGGAIVVVVRCVGLV